MGNLLINPYPFPTNPLLGGLHDEFSGGSLDGTKWRTLVGSPTVTGGVLECPAGISTIIATQTTYDLTAATIRVEIKDVGVHVNQQFTIGSSDGGSDGYAFYLLDGSPSHTVRVYRYGFGDVISPVTYDPLVHKYWQIRVASGTIYFETSANLISWDLIHSETVVPTITSDYVYLRGLDLGGISSTQTFDNFDSTL